MNPEPFHIPIRPTWLAVIVLLALVPRQVGAQPVQRTFATDPEYLIDAWLVEDGLPESSATAMVQARDGYLWFGTFDGLVRFDGLRCLVVNPDNTPGIPSASVVNLHQDRRGRLWVSTYKGIASLSQGRWTTYGKDKGFTGIVRTFAEKSDGALLMTTFDGLVFEFSDEGFRQLPAPPGRPGQGYLGCVADATGQWFVVQQGASDQQGVVARWDGNEWVSLKLSPGAPLVGAGQARDGGIWLHMGRELRKWSCGEEVARVELPELVGGFWSLYEDGEGNVWICTFDRGLYRVCPRGELRHWDTGGGLSSNSTRFVFEDREKNLWVGTSGGGLMRFKTRRFHSFGAESGLTEPVVSSICSDSSGAVWIATYGKGIFRLSAGRLESILLPGYEGKAVYAQSVLADRSGRIWVGTFGQGLWVRSGRTFERVADEKAGGGNVVAMFEDSRGRIWLSGGQAVSVYDNGAFQVLDQPRGPVIAFAEDREGSIWMSDRERVLRATRAGLQEVVDEQGAPIPETDCFHADSDGSIWMGSARQRLLRWKEGRLQSIGRDSGLPPASVRAILDDGTGHLWLCSNRGIARVRASDLRAAAEGGLSHARFDVFNTADGLPGIECAAGRQPVCARDPSGGLWFATSKGVGMTDPARLVLNNVKPPAHIEEVSYSGVTKPARLGDQSEAPGDEKPILHAPFTRPLVLPAGTSRLAIRYTGLSLTSPERVRFQVMLEGVDPDWQDVGTQRVAYYHEPRPGDYVFRVRSSNDDGIWNEAGASLDLRIQAFFWQTSWFLVTCGAVLTAGGAGATWSAAHRKHRRTRQKLERAHQFSVALVKLATNPAMTAGDRVKAFAAITEAAASVMGVLRVGIWLFDKSDQRLHGVDIYDASTQRHERNGELEMAAYPRYCLALEDDRTIDASDALRDPRTVELRDGYIVPKCITSMLDAPVRVGGRLTGVVCHEHVGPRRVWTDDEIAFAAAIADQVAQAILRSDYRNVMMQLFDSEQRMNLAAEAAHIGMWVWQIQKNQLWATDECRRLYALSPDEDLSMETFFDRVHPQDREAVRGDVRDAVSELTRFDAEYRLLLPDGSVRWISTRGRVQRDVSNNAIRMQGVSIDVTERRTADERFRLAVEASPAAMIMVGPDGKILLVNAQTERMFGYDRPELIGQPIEMLIPTHLGADHQRHREPFGQRPETRRMGVEREVFGRRKDGSEVPVEIGLNPIDATEGNFVMASIVDVTERRRAEAEAARQRNELAHLSRVNLLGELSGSLAHELNQPLMAILSNAQAAQRYLERGELDMNEFGEILEDIVSQDQRAGEVIQRLRLLLKKGQVQQHPLNLNEVVQDVLKLMHSDLTHHNVAVRMELAPDLATVRGDRVQLQQVILNLVINGCDAMSGVEDAHRKLLLKTGRSRDGRVMICVSDEGCGIPPGQVESIFEPFYTTKPQGMGLGLAVCRTIIAAHGGSLWATNNVPRGATFHVALPPIDAGTPSAAGIPG